MPARGDYLEGKSLRDQMRFLHALMGGGTELTEAQLQRVQSKGTQKNMVAVIAGLLGGKAVSPSGPKGSLWAARKATAKATLTGKSSVTNLSAEDTAYWQQILDNKAFAIKEGGEEPGDFAFIRKTARTILKLQSPKELANRVEPYLLSVGLEPATRSGEGRGKPTLAQLVLGVIDKPEELPAAEKQVKGMFPPLKARKRIAPLPGEPEGLMVGARSKAEGLKLEAKALEVVRRAAAERGVPEAGPAGYQGKLLPAVAQTTVGEEEASAAMAASAGKRFPAVRAGTKKPAPSVSKKHGRVGAVKEIVRTAETAESGARRAKARSTLDRLSGRAGGGKMVDPRVLAALGIPAALVAKIAQAGKGGAAAATPTARTTGGAAMALPTRTRPPARPGGGVLEQLLGGGSNTMRRQMGGLLGAGAPGAFGGPTSPAGAPTNVAAGALGLGALGAPGAAGAAGGAAKTSPLMQLFSKKGLMMTGGGLILGLLISHLMDRMTGPENIRQAGRLQEAQMPPAEVMAQRAQLPGQMGQNQMLSQMLMSQMMGGGGQRMSPYEVGR